MSGLTIAKDAKEMDARAVLGLGARLELFVADHTLSRWRGSQPRRDRWQKESSTSYQNILHKGDGRDGALAGCGKWHGQHQSSGTVARMAWQNHHVWMAGVSMAHVKSGVAAERP
jgi:hypothetical protein